jgi:hypothetical protein
MYWKWQAKDYEEAKAKAADVYVVTLRLFGRTVLRAEFMR